MRTLGIRAKPGEVTFAIFDVEQDAVLNVEVIKIPKALSRPDALKYVRNNVLDVIEEYAVSKAGVRVTESAAQSQSIERIEIEGVIQEAFASSCLESYYVGQIASIAKRLGIDRNEFKPYVENAKNFDAIEAWGDLSRDGREAVFAALGARNA